MRINPEDILNKQKDTVVYNKKDILDMFKKNLPTVREYVDRRDDLHYNKYVNLALKNNYSNYRICSASDIHQMKLHKSLSYYVKNFINDNGVFLVILNELSGKPISAVMRSLKHKEFVDFSVYNCPYGLDLIRGDFKYGDPLMVTEGIYDSDSFRGIYQDIVSVLTSSITIMYAEILNTLTNKFILAFDRDRAGEGGFIKSKDRLYRLNPNVIIDRLNIYPDDKDLGDMEDSRLGMNEEYESRKEYYSNNLKILVS